MASFFLLLATGYAFPQDPRIIKETDTAVYLQENRNAVFRLGSKIQTEVFVCDKEQNARTFLYSFLRTDKRIPLLTYIALTETRQCTNEVIVAIYKEMLEDLGIVFLYRIETSDGRIRYAVTDIEVR